MAQKYELLETLSRKKENLITQLFKFFQFRYRNVISMFQFELFSHVAESLPLLDSDETATFAVAGHLDLDGDAVFEFLAVGDDADAAVALAGYLLEFLEGCHDGIEAVVVEGAIMN